MSRKLYNNIQKKLWVKQRQSRPMLLYYVLPNTNRSSALDKGFPSFNHLTGWFFGFLILQLIFAVSCSTFWTFVRRSRITTSAEETQTTETNSPDQLLYSAQTKTFAGAVGAVDLRIVCYTLLCLYITVMSRFGGFLSPFEFTNKNAHKLWG